MRILLAFAVLALLNGAILAQDSPPLPSPQEAKAQFEKADAALNQAWAKLKSALSPEDFAKLKESQRDWIQYRDQLALSPSYSGAPADENVARKSPEYLVTAAELTRTRTQWLDAYNQPLKNNSLTGVWNDSNGGEMQIVEKDGKIYFSISVVRGPTAHNGDIDGVTAWKANKGFYSDKGLVPGKTEISTLTFTLKGTRMEVVGDNTLYYHGARAYFDGSYLCIAPLSAAEQAALLAPAK